MTSKILISTIVGTGERSIKPFVIVHKFPFVASYLRNVTNRKIFFEDVFFNTSFYIIYINPLYDAYYDELAREREKWS